MKVKDLIAALQRQDPEAQVYTAFPSGNYWRHEHATPTYNVEVARAVPAGSVATDRKTFIVLDDDTSAARDQEVRILVLR